MGEMIERVARAIAAAALQGRVGAVTVDDGMLLAGEYYRALARAAFEEMGFLDEAMLRAGESNLLDQYEDEQWTSAKDVAETASVGDIWRAMLSAALEDSGG